jgi:hypothetical protein
MELLVYILVLPRRHDREHVGRRRIVAVAVAEGLERILAVVRAPQRPVAARDGETVRLKAGAE